MAHFLVVARPEDDPPAVVAFNMKNVDRMRVIIGQRGLSCTVRDMEDLESDRAYLVVDNFFVCDQKSVLSEMQAMAESLEVESDLRKRQEVAR